MGTKKTVKTLTTAEGSTAGSHLSTVALITEKQTSRVITAAKDYTLPKRKDQEKWWHQSLEEEQGKETRETAPAIQQQPAWFPPS